MASRRPALVRLTFFVLCRFASLAASGDDRAPEVHAEKAESILIARCIRCHIGDDAKGGLDLSQRSSALRGGKNGAAFLPGSAEESLLWQRVADDEMPPKEPLNEADKSTLAAWIESGAAWPASPLDPFRISTGKSAGYDWWAFRPLQTDFSKAIDIAEKGRNPIDIFVDRELKRHDAKPNPQAKPRDLIRRLAFDLTGLPPEPELVAAFESDPSRKRYETIVDRFLASPRFGERWARHWLDVVRYGESTGFERNEPNYTLWPYRDWIVKALNDDLPYDQFARMQLAGDVIAAGPEGAAASAFLVAGVHNTVIGVSRRMRLLARQDELEEIVGTMGQTFLGLTIQCARCHDHKFDPITAREYYGVISAIDGVQHGERTFESRETAILRNSLESRLKAVSAEISRIENAGRERPSQPAPESIEPDDLPKPYAMWTFDDGPQDGVGSLHGTLTGGVRIESGELKLDGKTGYFRTPTLKKYLSVKTFEAWVMTDDLAQRGGGIVSQQSDDGAIFDAIVFGEQEPRRWMAGSDGFSRTSSFRGPEETEAAARPVHIAITYDRDGMVTCYRDGMPYGLPYKSTPAKFPVNGAHIAIGLRHLPAGGNRHFKGSVLRAAVYDRALKPEEIARSAARESGFLSVENLTARLGSEMAEKHRSLRSQREQLGKELTRASAAPMTKIYAVNAAAKPGPMRVHLRGDVTEFGPVVSPGGLKAVRGDFDWAVSPDSTDRERRTKLAEWIASPENPLFARVIVNRLWHHHFGIGIVETPNDFGFNGGRPSHPELLDFLARSLVDNGFRLKPLHRLIVTSDAYMRSAEFSPENARADAQNRLLWRHAPTRLEGEALRDAMLAVSGELNVAMGGPGYVDVTVTPNNGTTYYEPIDTAEPNLQRRTIYRFSPRGGRSTLLDSFDCPDASATSPRRNVTTTPLQALSLLHGEMTVRLAHSLAERAEREAGQTAKSRVERCWSLVLQRSPDADELAASLDLAERHGLWAVCLGLFNANEFVVTP